MHRHAWSMLKIVVHYMNPAWMLLGLMMTSCKVDVRFHIQEPCIGLLNGLTVYKHTQTPQQPEVHDIFTAFCHFSTVTLDMHLLDIGKDE